jgi:hypothetical protein
MFGDVGLVGHAILIGGVPGKLPAVHSLAQKQVVVDRLGQLVAERDVEGLGVVILQLTVVGFEVEWD